MKIDKQKSNRQFMLYKMLMFGNLHTKAKAIEIYPFIKTEG